MDKTADSMAKKICVKNQKQNTTRGTKNSPDENSDEILKLIHVLELIGERMIENNEVLREQTKCFQSFFDKMVTVGEQNAQLLQELKGLSDRIVELNKMNDVVEKIDSGSSASLTIDRSENPNIVEEIDQLSNSDKLHDEDVIEKVYLYDVHNGCVSRINLRSQEKGNFELRKVGDEYHLFPLMEKNDKLVMQQVAMLQPNYDLSGEGSLIQVVSPAIFRKVEDTWLLTSKGFINLS